MSNIIREKLENGEEYVFDMDVCNEAATASLDELYSMEGEVENFDFAATVFSLFASCIHILTESGWTTADLLDAVITHTEQQDVRH
jgi:hypothetical protein